MMTMQLFTQLLQTERKCDFKVFVAKSSYHRHVTSLSLHFFKVHFQANQDASWIENSANSFVFVSRQWLLEILKIQSLIITLLFQRRDDPASEVIWGCWVGLVPDVVGGVHRGSRLGHVRVRWSWWRLPMEHQILQWSGQSNVSLSNPRLVETKRQAMAAVSSSKWISQKKRKKIQKSDLPFRKVPFYWHMQINPLEKKLDLRTRHKGQNFRMLYLLLTKKWNHWLFLLSNMLNSHIVK